MAGRRRGTGSGCTLIERRSLGPGANLAGGTGFRFGLRVPPAVWAERTRSFRPTVVGGGVVAGTCGIQNIGGRPRERVRKSWVSGRDYQPRQFRKGAWGRAGADADGAGRSRGGGRRRAISTLPGGPSGSGGDVTAVRRAGTMAGGPGAGAAGPESIPPPRAGIQPCLLLGQRSPVPRSWLGHRPGHFTGVIRVELGPRQTERTRIGRFASRRRAKAGAKWCGLVVGGRGWATAS